MEFETLTVETNGNIGRLTLDNPAGNNSLGPLALKELAQAAHWFNQQIDVTVVIVSGKGKWFSPGADIKGFPTADNPPESGSGKWLEERERGQLGYRMAEAIEGMRAITIAQVHRVCVGGALVLMLACDLRLVAEGTYFSIPEVDIGIPLAWGGIPRMMREIGPARTKELVMTCRPFTPEEALQMGMINRVVPVDQLAAEVDELAQQLAAKPVVPMVITKEHVNQIGKTMTAGMTGYADGDALVGLLNSPQTIEAMTEYVAARQKKK